MMAAWAARYVGIPFIDNGLDRAGCHCWGLVRLVLRIEAGVEVPSYGELSAADLLASARQFRASVMGDPWIAVIGARRIFDVVLMYAMASTEGGDRRVPGHVGILVDPDHVLHIWRATDSMIMPLDHPRVRHRIINYYRHGLLA